MLPHCTPGMARGSSAGLNASWAGPLSNSSQVYQRTVQHRIQQVGVESSSPYCFLTLRVLSAASRLWVLQCPLLPRHPLHRSVGCGSSPPKPSTHQCSHDLLFKEIRVGFPQGLDHTTPFQAHFSACKRSLKSC